VIWVTDDKKHGLVVSIINLGPTQGDKPYTLRWGPTTVTTGAINNAPLPTDYTNPSPKENYSGYENQKIIERITDWETNYPAFAACKDYSITIGDKTYNDWFLPTLTELQQIYAQRAIVNDEVDNIEGGQALFTNETDPAGSFYWSSLEGEGTSPDAWSLGFLFGIQSSALKFIRSAVRCVRAF
jgi:hypothetical protein